MSDVPLDGASSVALAIPGGVVSAAVLGALLALAVVHGLARLRGVEPRRVRLLLGALRIATAPLAWVVAVQPRWLEERVDRRDGALALVVDSSRSMGVPGDRSRNGRARALLSRWAEGRDEPVATFTFGEILEAADLGQLAGSLPADADRSQLGAALDTLLAQPRGQELGAVVVLSDGADRSGIDPAALGAAGVRIHTVAVGEDDLRDDAIALAEADPVAFLRRSARVRVRVRSSGGPGGPIPVSLRRGEQLVREVVAEVPPDGEAEVDIPFTPSRLGRAVYQVSIPRREGDAVPENNRRAFLVRVTRDKLRVLLVAGQPSWDQRFLRSFLKRDPATDLISFFILRNTSDLTMAGPDDLALIPFPTDELFNEHLGSFDLVLFQNFEYGPYQMGGYLPRIRDYVLRGGSFAMIGGPLSFGSGAYRATPVAEVLPVDLPPADAPERELLVYGDFAPRLAPGLARHPLLALLPDPSQTVEAWARLAPLSGANGVARVRPGATVLLAHPTARSGVGSPLPILVTGTAGRGRVLALTTDTSWRWGISTGGATGDGSAYERFWDRAVRWLARDPTLEPAVLTTDRERYGPGARVAVRGRLADERYQPLADRPVSLRLRDLEGAEVARYPGRVATDGAVEVAFDAPAAPGAYTVEAWPEDAEEPAAEEVFLIEAGGDELADPRADPALLARLSEAAGGRFVASPEDAPALSAFDTSRVRSLGTVEKAPFASLWAFALLVLGFTAEWVLRRRAGRA
ncbi:MAG: glutamine amidotransferase [Sandaracinaceae bacterium]